MAAGVVARDRVRCGDPALPRTRFIVVGDHAPAFVLQSRARDLRKGVVPFVELIPKGKPKNRPNNSNNAIKTSL